MTLTSRTIGRQLVELAVAESTNTAAAELLRASKVRHGTVVLAHEQTAGRGQRGRSWASQAGRDLTFSIVLEPADLRAEHQFGLAKVAALAVHDAVAAHVTDGTSIKWPNDVLIGRRKVAGILIECELAGELVRSAIVGIGLNVNSSGHDPGLNATTLFVETGRELDRMALLGELCQRFEERWEQARRGRGGAIDRDYAAHLWERGHWTGMFLDGRPVRVRPMDVAANGRLTVEHEDGRILAYGLERLRFAPR